MLGGQGERSERSWSSAGWVPPGPWASFAWCAASEDRLQDLDEVRPSIRPIRWSGFCLWSVLRVSYQSEA